MLSRRISALQSLSALAAEGWATRAPAATSTAFPRFHSELAPQGREEREDVLYEGPFAGAVRRVKKLSLFSAGCAVAAGPIILGLDAQNTMTAKLSIAATLTTFGLFTTGLMHWFTHPYVQRLVYHPADESVEITNLSLFAKPVTRRFHLAEVKEVDSVHPLTSFEAGGEKYYVDAEHFPNKALLSKLIPQSAASHAMEAADKERQAQEQQQQQQ